MEFGYGCSGGRSVDSVCGQFWNGGVSARDYINLLLELTYFAAGGAVFQVISRPGGGDSGDGFSGVDVHVVAVIVAENFDSGIALVAEGFGAPLCQPDCYNL